MNTITFDRVIRHIRQFTSDMEVANYNKLSFETEQLTQYVIEILKEREHKEWVHIEVVLDALNEVCPYIEMFVGNEVLYDDEGNVFVRDVSVSFTYAIIAMINSRQIDAKILNGKPQIKLIKKKG